ncbi:MAG: cytochrome b N-terminal domain-containing protein [Nitrososphaerales archaeon]|nr:cytochrome b N-terminal domain-containing protein [Nitrososphaerales archaeon]
MGTWTKLVGWLDSRLGLSAAVLRPVPDYSLNPLYWLGALMMIAFGVQVFTGLLMLVFYVPTVEQAYSSSLYIMKYLPLGQLIQTVHLYTAYAMILLAFLHMMRGYFSSVHKKPREVMWVLGVLMGLLVLGLGLTGYLLPWTVVSKSATDVSIGMLSFLPAEIGSVLTFLIAGPGGSAGELTRFFDLHIVVLPAMLLVLLVVKMYMFEVHGAAKPPGGEETGGGEVPWFPGVLLYFAMMGGVFIAIILAVSALFPMSLPAEFTPLAASSYVPQPEWYFLWIYQVLKFSLFEGSGIYYALGGVTAILLLLILLPFFDRGEQRDPAHRPLYVTVGLVGSAELVMLTVWGYFTPGQVIPDLTGVVLLGDVALGVLIISYLLYRVRRLLTRIAVSSSVPATAIALPFRYKAITGVFVLFLGVGSVALASTIRLLGDPRSPVLFAASGLVLLAAFYFMARIVKRLTAAYPGRGSR